MKRKEEED